LRPGPVAKPSHRQRHCLWTPRTLGARADARMHRLFCVSVRQIRMKRRLASDCRINFDRPNDRRANDFFRNDEAFRASGRIRRGITGLRRSAGLSPFPIGSRRAQPPCEPAEISSTDSCDRG
jgi:hypothetical protein